MYKYSQLYFHVPTFLHADILILLFPKQQTYQHIDLLL